MKNLNITSERRLILVGGPSKVGKTSIINELIKQYPTKYCRPISYTTRARRIGEDDSEYKFISTDEIKQLFIEGNVLTIDEAYGNLYAMDKQSIEEKLKLGYCVIKEIHPRHHQKIHRLFPKSLSLLFLPVEDNIVDISDDNSRIMEDRNFFNNYDISDHDLVIHVSHDGLVKELSEITDHILSSFLSLYQNFPHPGNIDNKNRSGYDSISQEFDDQKRITTRNFHQLTEQHFQKAIDTHIHQQASVLEIGPGSGWIVKKFPEVVSRSKNYLYVDISKKMTRNYEELQGTISSSRAIKIPQESIDICVSSLADPILFPASILEIWRVLKPGGRFIFSTPSSEWSDRIRETGHKDETTFIDSKNNENRVFSFTFANDQLRKMLSACGFKIIEFNGIFGSKDLLTEISPALLQALDSEINEIDRLRIIDFVIAEKEK